MRKAIALLCGTFAFAPAFGAAPATEPPVPPAKPVTETLFGTKVTDAYRYFEAQPAPVVEWMKAEGRYTRSVLDALPQHAAILSKLSAMTGSFDVVQSITPVQQRTFYEQRSAGSDNFDLMVREADGTVRKLVDVGAIRAAHGGEPFAINYFTPSNDGTKVALGISEGGSEDASLYVYDVPTAKPIAGPIPNAQFGGVSWLPGDNGLFTTLLNPLKPGEPETDKYKNSKAYVWDLNSAPVPVLGPGISPNVPVNPAEFPYVGTVPGSPVALAGTINGVQNEIAVWTAPVAAAASADAPWTKLVGRDDDVTRFSIVGDRIFLLSHKNAPTFEVLEVRAGQPLSAAKLVVAPRPGRLIEGISAASDGLYVNARNGVYSELFKIPLDGGAEQPIALPIKGSINEIAADPRTPGVKLIVDSWAVPPKTLAYDPTVGRFSDLGIGSEPKGFDPTRYEVLDLKAKARDGVEVPLSFVTEKGAAHPRPLLLWAYGSYGISQFPGFGSRTMVTLPNGIDYAVCHVRGGGELGEAWRLAGKDANKPNTWRDLIACGEQLIASGYTRKDMLFIGGGSAGGITMGRAMEEAPDLFAGVFDLVPAANATRSEFSPNGPPNIPEFGTVTNEQGFRNLLAMDSVVNVKRGVRYPPIMITTGLNDPRVSSWEPAKLAATLRAAGDPNPVLLRIDEKAGHGIGSTKTQSDQLNADIATFILWQSGKEAQPNGTERGRR
jgi:prolyl oligopeptidase